MINLVKQRVFLGGISNMIYDHPSEMVPEQYFGMYVFFLHLQGSKTYSEIGIQYATC